MEDRWRMVVVYVALIGLLCGCQEQNRDAGKQPMLHLNSTADLKKLLASGSSTNSVLAALGPAHAIETPAKGTEVWIYPVAPFSADDDMQGTYVVGLQVYFTNGILAGHHYTYAETQNATRISSKAEEVAAGSTRTVESRLRIFVLSPELVEGGRSANYVGFPNLGFVHSQPDMEISKTWVCT